MMSSIHCTPRRRAACGTSERTRYQYELAERVRAARLNGAYESHTLPSDSTVSCRPLPYGTAYGIIESESVTVGRLSVFAFQLLSRAVGYYADGRTDGRTDRRILLMNWRSVGNSIDSRVSVPISRATLTRSDSRRVRGL